MDGSTWENRIEREDEMHISVDGNEHRYLETEIVKNSPIAFEATTLQDLKKLQNLN
jgi:hypothetical protein